MGHEFVHLDQPLAIELPANPRVRGVFRIAFWQESLTISNDSDEKTVNLCDSGVNLGTVVRPKLHVLAVVSKPRQYLIKAVCCLLVKGD